MIAARLRHGDAWSDANILNLSSRGLLLRASSPPARGAYVEVRRGAHVIVGRVIWATSDRFGVRAQDRLAIDALVANASPARQAANDAGTAPAERRSRPRPERLEWRHARSRERGRVFQFACIGGFGLALAACAYGAVSDTLGRPMNQVSSRLGEAP